MSFYDTLRRDQESMSNADLVYCAFIYIDFLNAKLMCCEVALEL